MLQPFAQQAGGAPYGVNPDAVGGGEILGDLGQRGLEAAGGVQADHAVLGVRCRGRAGEAASCQCANDDPSHTGCSLGGADGRPDRVRDGTEVAEGVSSLHNQC